MRPMLRPVGVSQEVHDKEDGNDGREVLSEQHTYLEQQHESFSETERKQLDMAGLTAIRFPDLIWTIIVDAATQRNFGAPVPD